MGGLVDESCQYYEARDNECVPENVCRNCDPNGDHPEVPKCYPVTRYPKFFVSAYGMLAPLVSGNSAGFGPAFVKLMQREIYDRGPIACSISSDPLIKEYGGPGKIVAARIPAGGWDYDHLVSVAGWQVAEKGAETLFPPGQYSSYTDGVPVPVWNVRNSWGTAWGERGWFRVLRGDNVLGIERKCSWADVFVEPEYKDWGPIEDASVMFKSVVHGIKV